MKKLLIAFVSLAAALTLAGCDRFENPNETYCREGAVDGVYLCKRTWIDYFDTTVTLQLYVTADDSFDLIATFDAVEAILSRYHKYFDKYFVYEGVANAMTLNLSGTTPTVVDREFFDALAFAIDAADDIVVGDVRLFNPALGPVLSVWHDARENEACEVSILGVSTCPVPAAALLAGPFETSLADVILDSERLSVAFAKAGMSIDLGGFGKGYVAELVTDYLDGIGARYIFNAGNSNVKAGGVNPNNDTGLYYVALTRPTLDPSPRADYYVYLKVGADVSIVTSGNYQRFFFGAEDGEVYHHIIDPRTNRPGGEAMALTILIEDGARGDIYSTALYLMTVAEGLAFVEATDGLEAVWYLEDGSVVVSSGMDAFVYQWIEIE